MRLPSPLLRVACVALAGIATACGGRSPLAEESFGGSGSSPPVFLDDGGTTTPVDAGPDPCPAAVLIGAGRPMVGNCSTRDGRSRVHGPSAPHVTWEAPSSVGVLAADAAGHVFVTRNDDPASGYSLARIDAATGVGDWTVGGSPGTLAGPLLLEDRTMNVSVTGANVTLNLESLDPETGAEYPLPGNREPNLAWGSFGPAVGVEGGLYFPVSGAHSLAVLRTAPNGSFYWKTGDLLPDDAGELAASSAVALAPGDVVLIAGQTAAGVTTLYALNPATGDELWSFAEPGTLLDGPVVGADGAAILLTADPSDDGTVLRFLDPNGSLASSAASEGATRFTKILGVSTDGTVLVSGEDASDNALLIAVRATGSVAWNVPMPGLARATIDENGAVFVAASAGILGVDLASGSTEWTLAAPGSVAVGDFVLTSAAGLVGMTVLGTLFGASD